jgi:hypothetical protein
MSIYELNINWKDGDKHSETYDNFSEVVAAIQEINTLLEEEKEIAKNHLDSITINKDGEFFAKV